MFSFTISIGIAIVLISCFLEFIDSTVGMGYGTTLTPILLLIGFKPLQIIPAVLLAEFATGILAGLVHHLMGNADFSIKKHDSHFENDSYKTISVISKDLKAVLVIGGCSFAGAIVGALIALNLPSFYLKLYIGVLITLIGVYILITKNKHFKFSWTKLIGIGLIASFNKAISGGGFGPVVTGGQVLSGVKIKKAIAITAVAEAIACVAGLLVYMISRETIDWILMPYLLVGGILSVPFSGIVVRKLKTERIVIIVGIAITMLGLFTLTKLL